MLGGWVGKVWRSAAWAGWPVNRWDRGMDTAEPADEHGDVDLTVRATRSVIGVFTWVDASIVGLLGWHPEDLVGFSSTRFIHPDDQAGAFASWARMLDSPDGDGVWRGRYQSA